MPTGRIRTLSSDRVVDLAPQWWWCTTTPGCWASPQEALQQSGGADWHPAARFGTAADMLRRCDPAAEPGEWTGMPRGGFDGVDWWWCRRVGVPDGDGPWQLELDGLATLAEVWLHDSGGDEVRLLVSRNMFRAHVVALPALQPETELWVCLRSVDAELARRRGRPRWRAPMVAHPQLRWLRTTLLGRTPGWSPPVPPVGAWRGLRLRQRVLPVEPPTLRAWLDGRTGCVAVTLVPRCPVARVELVLKRGDTEWRAALSGDAGGWSGELRLPHAALWWPHTHGEPVLHAARLEIFTTGDDASLLVPHVLRLGPVGFRRIEVDTRDGDFLLSVNGVPVFCRGAVWTPRDVVAPGGGGGVALRTALAQVRAAGMNMLRVAGTTVYETPEFFDACDAEGVLVWQDLMFASMDYPADDLEWRADALAEIDQQLAAWQARASLAVVCGNSEVSQQAAMAGAPRAAWAPAWFHEVLAQRVRQRLPDTFYWPSSAWGGAFPHQVSQGTTSYYGVGAYLRTPEDARLSGLRFATECLAFAQVPDDAAIARLPGGSARGVAPQDWKARVPRDLGAGWDFEDVRDHYLAQLFAVDPAEVRRVDPALHLRLARITSAERLVAALVAWRRVGSPCRGALLLWLRDLWGGAGWGVLDERGRPKSAWHPLRRVLQPQAVLLTDEGLDGLVAHLINEGPQPLQARLIVTLWDAELARETVETDVHLAPRSAAAVPLLALFEHIVDLTGSHRFGPPLHRAVQARLVEAVARDGSVEAAEIERASHWYLLPGWGRLLVHDDAPAPGLVAEVDPVDRVAGLWRLTLRTARLALHVAIEVPGFQPEDDHFHLAPGARRVVLLVRETGVSAPVPIGRVVVAPGRQPVIVAPAGDAGQGGP